MTEAEINTVLSSHNAAIIAPAGHGKTEMIADMVAYSPHKALLLTHTNAGVDALLKRLKKRKVSPNLYSVYTIAAFCMKWCLSYFKTGVFDKSLSPLNKNEAKRYYAQLYSGTKKILETNWAAAILKATYSCIIIDEYQDCTQEQHEIFQTVSNYINVIVLGDPMQGIFGFAGNLVNWATLPFPQIKIETHPWRWDKTNKALGAYLSDIRQQLLPILKGNSCCVKIDSCNGSIEIVSPDHFNGYNMLSALSQFKNVVFITQWPQQQLNFCSQMPGIFQYDETQECTDLFDSSQLFDQEQGAQLLYYVMEFVKKCVTNMTSLDVFKTKLQLNNWDFSRIRKNSDFGDILKTAVSKNKHLAILDVIGWVESHKDTFKPFRRELLEEMKRSIRFSLDNGLSIYESSIRLRRDSSLQKRYSDFKYLSSRTLLSKGLEFDCVIIDMQQQLSARDFYVAMTRAMKKIYIVSDTNTFTFNK